MELLYSDFKTDCRSSYHDDNDDDNDNDDDDDDDDDDDVLFINQKSIKVTQVK